MTPVPLRLDDTYEVTTCCPVCLQLAARLTPTRKHSPAAPSLRVACICGLNGFLNTALAVRFFAAWQAVRDHPALVQALTERRDALAVTVDQGSFVDGGGVCPACLASGAILRADKRGKPYLAHKGCRLRLFGEAHHWPSLLGLEAALHDEQLRQPLIRVLASAVADMVPPQSRPEAEKTGGEEDRSRRAALHPQRRGRWT